MSHFPIKNTASAIAIFTAPCNMALMACSMNCWNDRDESADNFCCHVWAISSGAGTSGV